MKSKKSKDKVKKQPKAKESKKNIETKKDNDSVKTPDKNLVKSIYTLHPENPDNFSFSKKQWVSGQIIFSDDMNRIETGVGDLFDEVSRMSEIGHEHPEYFGVGDAKKMEQVVEALVENAANEEDRVNSMQDELIALERSKVTKIEGLGLSEESFLTSEKQKLRLIEDGANRYVHPSTHSTDEIVGLHSVATSGMYDDLIGTPTHLPAEGGNADTVDGKHVDDTKMDTSHLWTSRKISDELSEKVNIAQVGTEPGQIPSLGDDAKLPKSVLPSISINETFTADTESKAMEIVCEIGDIVIVGTTVSKSYICVDDTATVFDDKFKLLQSGTDTMPRAEIESNLDLKVDKVSGKALSANDFTNDLKSKLVGIEAQANKYIHPSTDGNLHVPANSTANKGRHLMATDQPGVYVWNTVRFIDLPDKPSSLPASGGNADTIDNKHVDDGVISQGTLWTSERIVSGLNEKVDKVTNKGLSTHDFSTAYKTKLDDIQPEANRYVHPPKHPASVITQDENNRFVSDKNISYWNAKVEVDAFESGIENIKYKSSVPSTVTVGGIEKGFTAPTGIAVKDLLFNLLHKYVEPRVGIKSSLAQGVYEIGASHANVTFEVTGYRESDRISSLRLYRGTDPLKIQNFDLEQGNVSFTHTESAVDGECVYTAEADDGKNFASQSITYRFVHPIYIGSVLATTLTENDIKAMTKKIVTPASQSFTYTIDNKRMCIAVPSGWTINQILDPNSFNITSSFNVTNVNVTALDGSVQQYKVYTSQPTTQTNFTVRFNI